MKLIINNCSDVQFILYLINVIKNYLKDKVEYSKLIKIEEFINTLPQYRSRLKSHITCREIIFSAIYNIKYIKYGNAYIITIDSNQKLYGLNAKLYDACKLINYGTLSIQGYPIFSDTMNYVAENIEFFYDRYTKGMKEF